MKAGIFGFLFGMWVLILVGGGIIVIFLSPISISGYGDMNWFLASSLKAVIAIILIVTWILILSKLKNWIFKKELES